MTLSDEVLDKETKKLSLWFDSAKEAFDFFKLAKLNKHYLERENHFDLQIQKASKYVKHKTKYRQGYYWKLLDIEQMATSQDTFVTSNSIRRINEWQHFDAIIANNLVPSLAIETTDHVITYNNIAQRIPRLMQSASCGTPSLIFQKIGNQSKSFHKGLYLKSLSNASKIFNIPCAAILYTDENRSDAETLLSEIIYYLLDSIGNESNQSYKLYLQLLSNLVSENERMASDWYEESILLKAGWLNVTDKEVKVVIRVNPDVQMWKTKGTGGLDPYPGLVAMTDLLLCRIGKNKNDRKKKLIVEFKNLKEDFWWFKRYPSELYLQMLIDPIYRMADEVIFRS